MKQLITIILITLSVSMYAQIGEVPVVEHNGEKCYEHTVEKKQTAYGISRLYKISINKLYEANPDAQSGLAVDQKLYIPLPKSEQTNTVKESNSNVGE